MERRFDRNAAGIDVLLLLIAGAVGCGGPEYQVAEVDGVLTIKGQPGYKVHIEFVPDAGVKGPSSAADTDPQGHFTLRLMKRDGSSPNGAVVGQHRVTLSDAQLSESATGQGVPIRFGPEYTLPSSTPLKQEVRPGKQSVRLEVP
jgi:hypothetical protein